MESSRDYKTDKRLDVATNLIFLASFFFWTYGFDGGRYSIG